MRFNGYGILVAMAALLVLGKSAANAQGTRDEIARGKYLVSSIGCSDCHTPGSFLGHPDMSRYLGGSDVSFAIPGLGVFDGPNLTPDKTGLGNWSVDEIVTALTKGERPDGRVLAPIMPWRAFANLKPEDARDIALYLKTLEPVDHANPGPWGPGEKPSTLVMEIVPPEVYMRNVQAAAPGKAP